MTEPSGVAQRLLDWYDLERRDLPWRATRDPWGIWVSEVMLQQTRTEVVRQLFPRFMGRFPTPRDLALALLASSAGWGEIGSAAPRDEERTRGLEPAGYAPTQAVDAVFAAQPGAPRALADGAWPTGHPLAARVSALEDELLGLLAEELTRRPGPPRRK